MRSSSRWTVTRCRSRRSSRWRRASPRRCSSSAVPTRASETVSGEDDGECSIMTRTTRFVGTVQSSNRTGNDRVIDNETRRPVVHRSSRTRCRSSTRNSPRSPRARPRLAHMSDEARRFPTHSGAYVPNAGSAQRAPEQRPSKERKSTLSDALRVSKRSVHVRGGTRKLVLSIYVSKQLPERGPRRLQAARPRRVLLLFRCRKRESPRV